MTGYQYFAFKMTVSLSMPNNGSYSLNRVIVGVGKKPVKPDLEWSTY